MRRVALPAPPAPVEVVDDAVAVLGGGGVVLLPTDTVYGLAVATVRPEATAKLFAAKGRPADVPVAVLVADAAQAGGLGRVDDRAAALMEAYWPGGLTLVLPRRTDVELELGSRPDTVGVRCPDHELLRRIAAEVGPLATTSANRHGLPTPAEPGEVLEQVGPDAVDLVVDAGPCRGEPSTVVDLCGPVPELRRQGPVVVDLTGYDRLRPETDGEF